jgi:hypothetical protein
MKSNMSAAHEVRFVVAAVGGSDKSCMVGRGELG